MFEQTATVSELGARVGGRAREDAAFRQQLRADPRAAVEQELGREPGSQSPYLVLPLTLDGPARSRPLSDAELQSCETGYPPPCFDCIGQGCFDRAEG